MSISIRYALRLILVSLLLPVSASTAYSSDDVWFFCTTFNDKMEFNISRLFRVDTSKISLKREEWVGTKREFEKYTKGDVGMCRAFESEEEALSEFMSTPNRVPYQEWKPSWMRGHKSSDPSTLGKSLGEVGAGAAVIARRSKSSSDTSSHDDVWEGLFSTKVASVMTGYIRKWEKILANKKILATKGDFDPIAGIVQIALFQLGFYPGPVDGHFDQKTVSAITKWKTEKGQWYDSIFELVAEILWVALVLEGHDPGHADEILGWLSVSHIQQSWEPTYNRYGGGIGRRSGENEPLRDFHITVPSNERKIRVCVRDHECEDGDRVQISVNQVTVLSGEIVNAWRCRDVPVRHGKNAIGFVALNGTGYKGNCSHADANTGEMRVEGVNSETHRWKHRGGQGSRANIIVNVQ